MNRQAVRTAIKYVLVNLLKLAGWKVFLIMHVVDILWVSLIGPWLKSEKIWDGYEKRVKRRAKMVKTIQETNHKRPLLEQTEAMLTAMGVKKRSKK